nr:N-acetylglucosamine-6-phosphate deacetylase [Rhizobium sp. ACO-34A]
MKSDEPIGQTTAVVADTLYDGTGSPPVHDVAIVLEGGMIASVCPVGRLPGNVEIMARAAIAIPGMIDLQINGGGGVLFNDEPTPEALEKMAAAARKGGTAFILPTYITAHGQGFADAMEAVEKAIAMGVPGILGIHLEGPFLSPKRPGIHPRDAIRPIGNEDIAVLSRDIGGPRLITLAPEEAPDGSIRELCNSGAIVFAGHSEASFEDMEKAAGEGISGATHLFNAMSQIAGRAPGLVGAVLDNDRLYAGIIADGVHVHQANLRLAAHSLGPDRLCLVTDAMSTLGTALESFDLLGKQIFLRDGRLVDMNGTLAGAHIALDECLRNMMRFTGINAAEAVQMATSAPAHAVGLGATLGRVASGYRAALTLMDEDFKAVSVVIDSKLYPST